MSGNTETDNNNDAGSQNEASQKDGKGQGKGSKKSKQKGKTMSLAAFNAQSEQHPVANWADHVETVSSNRPPAQPTNTWQPRQSSKYGEQDSAYELDIDPIRSQLPTAPRAAREPVTMDLSRIPENGPFKVHVGNLPFDISESAVANFFGTQERQVNLIKEQGRPKGFGFVEFDTRDLLIAALERNSESLHGRAIKVALATTPGAEGERYGRDGDRDRSSRGGWRNEGPREEVERNWRDRPERSDDRRGDDRNRRDDRDRRPDDRDRRPDDRERRFDDRERRFDDRDRRPDDRERRFDDRDRRPDDRDRRFDDRDRRMDDRRDTGRRFGGERRAFDDSRNDDRRRFERDDEPRNEESNWRRGLAQRRDQRDAGDTEQVRVAEKGAASGEASPQAEREQARDRPRERERTPERETKQPVERPKLQLQPRTKPLAEVGVQSGMSDNARKAIFGAAKPVDTVAREREIERRLDAEREKFEQAHELDDAVANRTRRRTVSSSSNASQKRLDDAEPAADRERLNSTRSNTSRLPEEEEGSRPQAPADRERERNWNRGGGNARGRFDRPPRRNPSDRDDEYYYDEDFRNDRAQSDQQNDASHNRNPRGAPRWAPNRSNRPRESRDPQDSPDDDGFQQVGTSGRNAPATHRAEHPGGRATAGPSKRTEGKGELTAPQAATLIQKSKFSALASANLDEDVPDEE